VTLPVEAVQNRILLIRGHKVMLDADLAMLYQVPTGNLVRAVKRNITGFLMISCSSSMLTNLRACNHNQRLHSKKYLLRRRT